MTMYTVSYHTSYHISGHHHDRSHLMLKHNNLSPYMCVYYDVTMMDLISLMIIKSIIITYHHIYIYIYVTMMDLISLMIVL